MPIFPAAVSPTYTFFPSIHYCSLSQSIHCSPHKNILILLPMSTPSPLCAASQPTASACQTRINGSNCYYCYQPSHEMVARVSVNVPKCSAPPPVAACLSHAGRLYDGRLTSFPAHTIHMCASSDDCIPHAAAIA